MAHPVKVLFDDGKNIAVSGNLKPGDPVIIEGQLRVDPGGPVRMGGDARRQWFWKSRRQS